MEKSILKFLKGKRWLYWVSIALYLVPALAFVLKNHRQRDTMSHFVIACYFLIMLIAGENAPIKIKKKTRVFKTKLYLNMNRILFIYILFTAQVVLSALTVKMYFNLDCTMAAIFVSGISMFGICNYYANKERMKNYERHHRHYHHHHHHHHENSGENKDLKA